MIPAALTVRLSACSPAELAVLWHAFGDLLDGIERGRAQYGSEPGRGNRDYVAEAQQELRDACLYLAMDAVKRRAFKPHDWPSAVDFEGEAP